MLLRYIIIFFMTLLLSILLTPGFVKIAYRLGAVDKPGRRRVNTEPRARMGGPAMFIAFAVSVLAFSKHIQGWQPVLMGSFIVLAVGLVDDVKPLKPMPKLFFQFVAAVAAYALGARIEMLSNPFGGDMFVLPGWFSFLITIAWMVGITNALNLIDGLDGLAAGIVSIASLTFFLVAVSKGQTGAALMSLAMVGAAGGFLRWNFYPAKTFMGDSGAYFLGFAMAALSVTGAFKSTTTLTLLIPVLALGVPIADTSFAILRRLAKRRPVMSGADRGHIHHRFLNTGWHHRDAVITCYLITFLLSSIALAITREWVLAIYLLLSVFVLTMILIGAGKIFKKQRKGGSSDAG